MLRWKPSTVQVDMKRKGKKPSCSPLLLLKKTVVKSQLGSTVSFSRLKNAIFFTFIAFHCPTDGKQKSLSKWWFSDLKRSGEWRATMHPITFYFISRDVWKIATTTRCFSHSAWWWWLDDERGRLSRPENKGAVINVLCLRTTTAIKYVKGVK